MKRTSTGQQRESKFSCPPNKVVKEVVGYPYKFRRTKLNADHFKFDLQTGPETIKKVICYNLDKKGTINIYMASRSPVKVKNLLEKELPENSPLCELSMTSSSLITKPENCEVNFDRMLIEMTPHAEIQDTWILGVKH